MPIYRYKKFNIFDKIMIGTAESFSLLSKIAQKLMKTYGDIKIMCDQGLQNCQNKQPIQGNENKTNNTIDRIQNQNMQYGTINNTVANESNSNNLKEKISQNKKSFQPKIIPSKSTDTTQKTQNQLTVNISKKAEAQNNSKLSDQPKQKIVNNMNRIQQKIMKSSTEQSKPKKIVPTNNSAPNTHTAYLIYFQERQPILSKKYPSLSITDVCQKINQQWQAMDSSKKASFKKQDPPKKNNNQNIKQMKKNDTKEESFPVSKPNNNQKITKGMASMDQSVKKKPSKKTEALSEQESNFDYLNGDVSDLQILDGMYNDDQEGQEQSE